MNRGQVRRSVAEAWTIWGMFCDGWQCFDPYARRVFRRWERQRDYRWRAMYAKLKKEIGGT